MLAEHREADAENVADAVLAAGGDGGAGLDCGAVTGGCRHC